MPVRADGAPGPVIDEFERELLVYVVAWAPYGGPPREEILPRFGILDGDLWVRVREISLRGLSGHAPPREAVLCQLALRAPVIAQ